MQIEWYDQYPEDWDGNSEGEAELSREPAGGADGGPPSEPSRLIRLLNQVPEDASPDEAARIVGMRRQALAGIIVDAYLASLAGQGEGTERSGRSRRSDGDLT